VKRWLRILLGLTFVLIAGVDLAKVARSPRGELWDITLFNGIVFVVVGIAWILKRDEKWPPTIGH
jgi:hypothetical protein